MRILAPFDQTRTSQAAIPLLARLAGMSRAQVEITLISVLCAPIGLTRRRSIRDGMAVPSYSTVLPVRLPDLERIDSQDGPTAEQVLGRLHDYLLDIAGRLPPGICLNTEAHISDLARRAIIDCADDRGADLIVMATRSRPRTSSLLFGSTTEAVIDSGVAPTLVVHPDGGDAYRQAGLEMRLTRRARIALSRAWPPSGSALEHDQ